jgi:hypothetical protein
LFFKEQQQKNIFTVFDCLYKEKKNINFGFPKDETKEEEE